MNQKSRSAAALVSTTIANTPQSPSSVVPPSIPIRVRPRDRRKLENLAWESGAPLAVVSAVALAAGSRLIRGEDTAALLRESSSHFLWRCLNRERSAFTERVPLADDGEGDLALARDDARQLGRTEEDWCGSLVMIGLEALAKKAVVMSMMSSKGVVGLIRAAAYEHRTREVSEAMPAEEAAAG